MADKPSEIHSVRKIGKELGQVEQLKKALSVFGPFLRLAGVDLSKIMDPLNDLPKARREFDEFAKVLDRFNDLFAARGWVAYDWLSIEVAKTAIAEAEAGDMDQAEGMLVQHYGADQISLQLRTLMGLASFRPRMRLAELALIDYREGRYHACVPVVLALLDGMVNDLGNLGFFSEHVDLTAWDSIAACDSGINELKTLLFGPRKKTTEETVAVPYRNGILHGRDLGYDNRMVAAKSWAALFATADWARRIEQGKRKAPPPEPELTLSEVIALLGHTNEAKARLEAWKPRRLEDMPELANGPDTPEAALTEFLDAWKNKRYDVMAKRTHLFRSDLTLNARAGEVRTFYRDLQLYGFEIGSTADQAPAVTEITVRGRGNQYGQPFDASGTFRLVNFDHHEMPVTQSDGSGYWYVTSWNPWQQAFSGDTPLAP
ncbi:MAG TPA: hypothetical protein VGK29_28220 [Paludibaculum sp.]|jgi:hypothetical protein